ncbi:hypothetical protein QQ045_033573 [Rhodiola kirilowii]
MIGTSSLPVQVLVGYVTSSSSSNRGVSNKKDGLLAKLSQFSCSSHVNPACFNRCLWEINLIWSSIIEEDGCHMCNKLSDCEVDPRGVSEYDICGEDWTGRWVS